MLLSCEIEDLENVEKLLEEFCGKIHEDKGPVMGFARRLVQLCVHKLKEEREFMRVSEVINRPHQNEVGKLQFKVARNFQAFTV